MNALTKQFGPADTWSDLEPSLALDHPLWKMSFDDVLVYYDGPIVLIGRFESDPNKSHYLRLEGSERSTYISPEFPRPMERTTYYLEFPSREAIEATLHEAKIPTLDTYRKAISIDREISTWTLVAAGKGTNCSVSVSKITLADIPDKDLPYAHIRPGNEMCFVADGFDELRMATSAHYLYPLPQDDVLVFHDVGRCWIGKTERFGQIKFHLNWMIDDREGREINHRLTFDSEVALRKTLYNGFVATRETYKKANRIKREILEVTDKLPGIWTLRVEALNFREIPEDELPNPDLKPSPKPA